MTAHRLILRSLLAVAVAALTATALAAAAGTAKAPTCVKYGQGWVVGKHTSAGSAFCDDDAKATLGGTAFRDGVCWKDASGFHVSVGVSSFSSRRKPSDPPLFELVDSKGTGAFDRVAFGKGSKLDNYQASFTYDRRPGRGGPGKADEGPTKGAFTGKSPGGTTSVRGTFTCRRVLNVPV